MSRLALRNELARSERAIRRVGLAVSVWDNQTVYCLSRALNRDFVALTRVFKNARHLRNRCRASDSL